LLNATVGVQRVIARLRPTPRRRSGAADTFHRRNLTIARGIRAGGVTALIRSMALPQVRGERLVSMTAVSVVAIALAVSNVATAAPSGPTGGPTGDASGARLSLGGAVSGVQGGAEGASVDGGDSVDGAGHSVDGYSDNVDGSGEDALSGDLGVATIDGPYLEDGTLVKPFAVDTSVEDGADLLRTYRVKSGDTLTGIARQFGVSMMTVWWANHLTSKDDLHIGQTLVIPPVNGIVLTVGAADTLESLAAKYGVDPAEIVEANALSDPNLVIGQTLMVPGALGAGIATPKPRPATRPATSSSSSGSSGSVRPPARYSGGSFAWPVDGGYISQYFHYGHYAIDIAADYGTRVKAAAAGTVIFAGWKSNGGGYQVWIAHGSGLYTTYNHMSAITVGRGQHVSRGQQVGRIGQSGNATGPHLHFEVWRGPIWDGGTRVNPLIYL
jgi:murein DD-endopeptidase MepM/ murein hydrolase activator NlpD